MFCNKCGAKLENDAQFCSMCGKKVEIIEGNDKRIPEKGGSRSSKGSKTIITVLAVLFMLSAVLNIVQITTPDVQRGDNVDSDIKTEQNNHDDLIEKAVEALTAKWIEIFKKDSRTNGYLEIYHTRIFDITPDESDALFQKLNRGMEIDYIIEFSLFSDYFAAAPYYHDAATYDTVIVYADGTTSVAGNFFRMYSNSTYSHDYSNFLAEIDDLGTSYNQVIRLN